MRSFTEVLARVQLGLERLYRVDTNVRVGDYLIDETVRAQLGAPQSPREQLLITEQDGALDIGLFVDRQALANLERNDPTRGLDDRNLFDFLIAVEGVSHFVYLVWRARADQQVSAVELELQAEVDKFVTCVLTCDIARADPAGLRRRLFHELVLEEDLDEEERSRYQVANQNALRYSESLDRRFLQDDRLGAMLAELRRFYRLSFYQKLSFIRSAP